MNTVQVSGEVSLDDLAVKAEIGHFAGAIFKGERILKKPETNMPEPGVNIDTEGLPTEPDGARVAYGLWKVLTESTDDMSLPDVISARQEEFSQTLIEMLGPQKALQTLQENAMSLDEAYKHYDMGNTNLTA
jgi:hypothetical protein